MELYILGCGADRIRRCGNWSRAAGESFELCRRRTILLLKPFVVGDDIIVANDGTEGTVKVIQIFYTKLTTVDNKTIVIPNGTLSNSSLTNVTARPERQLDLKVGIAYDADLKKAKDLIETLLKQDDSIIQDEDIKVFVDSLADSSVILGLRAWVKTEEYWSTRWRLLAKKSS